MPFAVLLTSDAERDLEEMYDFVTRHDAPHKADYVLAQVEKAFSRLSQFPEQGSLPKELLALGIREYREVFLKPYRIVYRVLAKNVYILLIAPPRNTTKWPNQAGMTSRNPSEPAGRPCHRTRSPQRSPCPHLFIK